MELKTWEMFQLYGMSVVESHTVISLHRYFISYVGVLPERCTGMGQTSTSNVTRHYQGACLWDKGKTKWVPLLINELVKFNLSAKEEQGTKIPLQNGLRTGLLIRKV